MSDAGSASGKEMGQGRLTQLADALVSLSYAQPDPRAYYFQFVDCLHLLACGPVAVEARPVAKRQRPCTEVVDCLTLGRIEVRVLGKADKVDFPEGSLASVVEVLESVSPWARELLSRALDTEAAPLASGTVGKVFEVVTRLQGSRNEDLDPLNERIQDVLGEMQLPGLDGGRGAKGPGAFGIHVRIAVPHGTAVATDGTGASEPAPKQEDGSASPAASELQRLYGRDNPHLRPLQANALQSGHLQASRDQEGLLAVAIPAHVGGAPWITVSLEAGTGLDAWHKALRLYTHTFSPLAALIRSEAADAYLDQIGEVLRSMNHSEGWHQGIDRVNRRLWDLAHVYPFSAIRIQRMGRARSVGPSHRRRLDAEVLPERPIPPQLHYRPLRKNRILAVARSELAIVDRRWAEQTDALVGGVYKFSHQLIHHLLPLRNKIDALKDQVMELPNAERRRLGSRVEGVVELCRKAQRFASVLDVLSTATLNGSGVKAFAEKKRSFARDPFRIDRKYFDAFLHQHWVAYAVRARPDHSGFVPLRLEAAIETDKGQIRPANEFYDEIFGEACLNAARKGIWDPEVGGVPLRIQSEQVTSGEVENTEVGSGLWAIVMENPCDSDTADRLQISADGTWQQWPVDGDSPKGGLFFIGLLVLRTEIGRVWVRVRTVESGRIFGLRVGLRWCEPSEEG